MVWEKYWCVEIAEAQEKTIITHRSVPIFSVLQEAEKDWARELFSPLGVSKEGWKSLAAMLLPQRVKNVVCRNACSRDIISYEHI